MRMRLVLLLAVVFAVSPLAGVAGEKQIRDVKELAGSWRGWVTEQTQERASMGRLGGRKLQSCDHAWRGDRGEVSIFKTASFDINRRERQVRRDFPKTRARRLSR